jgi:dethiobiotin synthetase
VKRGVFVTGTDTGVGKTVAACALIHALRAAGERVAPMKPIAAGAIQRGGHWVNEDTLALAEAAGLGIDAAGRVTPLLLREPMAPHIAAAREGRRIALGPIVQAFEAAGSPGDFHVVEGVGGFMVPLDELVDTADLAAALGLPVVLVVGMRLGCLNHALLAAQAVDVAGLRLAGWIANTLDPSMNGLDENVETLRARLRAPLLGRLRHRRDLDAVVMARDLDVAPLQALSA